MIRDSKSVRALIVTTVIVAIGVLTSAAQAGDSDGVLGYSMKLKNKEIPIGGTGGSGDGLVGGTTLSTMNSREPMLTSQHWVFVIPQIGVYGYMTSWSWMLLQPR